MFMSMVLQVGDLEVVGHFDDPQVFSQLCAPISPYYL